MGLNPHFKQPHITDNYYRFRQYNPHPDEKFRTGHIDGDKTVYHVAGNTAVLHPEVHRLG